MQQDRDHGRRRAQVVSLNTNSTVKKVVQLKMWCCCRCLGSSQDLKNKYGGGYILQVKWLEGAREGWQQLQARVQEIFPGAERGEARPGARQWRIDQDSMPSLHSAFSGLQQCK